MFLKYINGFLVGCWIFIISICTLFLFRAFHYTPAEEKVLVCGNNPMDITGDSLRDAAFAEGKAVFLNNCASCHHPLKDATGPALADIYSMRSQEWLCKFLTEPKFIPKDEVATTLRERYNLSCMKFPVMTCDEVRAATIFLSRYRH